MDAKRLKREEQEKQMCIFTHSIARQVVEYQDVTYSQAIQILENAIGIIQRNRDRQRASVPTEIRDRWGVIIGMSGAEAPDIRQ